MQGAQVVFLDVQDDAAGKLSERIQGAGGVMPIYRHCDLSDIEGLQRITSEILALYPAVEVLVNNAGNDTRHTVEEVSSSRWDELMTINLKQQYFMAQAMLPAMRRGGGGSIINMSSISWVIPSTGVPVYVTAKAAIVGMTRALAHTVGKDNIRVNSVMPGAIRDGTSDEAVADRGVQGGDSVAAGAEANDSAGRGRATGAVSCVRRQLCDYEPELCGSMVDGCRNEPAEKTVGCFEEEHLLSPTRRRHIVISSSLDECIGDLAPTETVQDRGPFLLQVSENPVFLK